MKKQLLFLLCLTLFGATNVWAADGDVFTAPVTVIEDGETKQVIMRFIVISEDDKSCETHATYDNVSDTYNPAINYGQNGKVVIPETVNGYTVIAIGAHSFNNCLFSYIQLPETIGTIGEGAFYKSLLKEIDVPTSNETILSSAFRECKYLTKARISCHYVPAMCFYGCEVLQSVEFKTPVEYVLIAAFQYCSMLGTLSFPEGLEYLNSGALRYCGPQTLILPSTLSLIWYDAFEGIHNLRDVIIARETPPTISGNSFANFSLSPVLHVPDRTKYLQEPWISSFSEIKSFLPTVEQTVNTWFNYSVGLTWPLSYTENYSASDVLDLVIDGKPTVPEVWEGYSELIVSKDPKHIPQEVSFLLMTSEGLVPYKLHYNVKNYGFSINGKEMTSVDMYDIPGLVSGDAYLAVKLNAPDYPTLVLDNATLEWDAVYGLYNHDVYQDGLTIKVIGDCSINAPKGLGFELDIATNTTITGGGTLRIQSQGSAFRCWIATTLTIQDNTTVIAESTGTSAFYDEDGANLEIKDGAVFAAYSTSEPISLDSNSEFTFGEGIGVRYPAGAYFGDWCFYYADGTRVKNDWVVIGPDNQTTRDLIAKINNAKLKLGFSINGKEMTGADMNDVPGVMSGSAYVSLNSNNEPTLVLNNATLDWNDANAALDVHSGKKLTIGILGDCVINAPDHTGLDLSGNTTIDGGGRLQINSKWASIETWDNTRFALQGHTTLIAHSSNYYGYVDSGMDYYQSWFIIEDGSLLAAFGAGECNPISINSDRFVHLANGIDVRYPIGGQLWNGYVYDADGNEVKNDWAIIGPDTQATQELIDGVGDVNVNANLNNSWFDLQGRKVMNPRKGIYIKDGRKILK